MSISQGFIFMHYTKEQQIKKKVLQELGLKQRTIEMYLSGKWAIPKGINELISVRLTK